MKSTSLIFLALSSFAGSAPLTSTLEERSLITTIFNDIEAALLVGGSELVVDALKLATPTTTPSSTAAAAAALQSIVETAKPNNIFEYTALLSLNGLLTESIESLVTNFLGEFSAENSETNVNPPPKTQIYPKSSCDAPYSVPEATLRAAIYIPPTFTYGKKPPVVLFPGTGNHGYESFDGNLIPLLTGSDWADPVWVNVPDRLLNDAQVNAEYAAYALNYIASVTGCNVTVASWSQGNINVQWAVKYWPSTRSTTSDHVGMSADYKGTENADFVCPNGIPCVPSVFQQRYLTDSNFIEALRSNGGDSGYVPTTSIYSGFYDEVVEPQQGTGASAYLLDARNVGVTNVEVQTVCPGQPAGSFYTHEGVLFNPLTVALLKDAMAHPGPGEPSRLDLASVCSTYLAPGLNPGDLSATIDSIAIAAIGILIGQPRATSEPAIKSYASSTGTCKA